MWFVTDYGICVFGEADVARQHVMSLSQVEDFTHRVYTPIYEHT